MIKSKPFIEKVINLRKQKKDPVLKIAIRNKASPVEGWSNFIPYSDEVFFRIFNLNIDGIKLKFRYTTLVLNGRHNIF
jgi:hypothetical protein